MSISIRRPLVLDSPEFLARAENFNNLMSVADFQERFFRDPAAIAAEEFGLIPHTATLSRSNRLTYALLTDPAFNTWAAEFQDRINTIVPPTSTGVSVAELKALKGQLLQEFSASVQSHLAADTAFAVQNVDGVLLASEDDIAIFLLVFVVFVVVLGATARADEVISRKTVQLLVRQLDQRQIEHIVAESAVDDG
jgi:hypothetical protein